MKWALLCGLFVIATCHQPAKRLPTAAPTTAAAAVTPRAHGGPVEVSVRPDAKTIHAGDTIDVLVVFDIVPTHEIQTRHARPPAVATVVAVGLPAGFEPIGEWLDPATVRSQWPDGHPVHVGRATFSRKVRISGDVKPGQYPLSCRVLYQACDDRYCLPPTKVRVIGSLTVASPPAGSPR
jgi:hypothetical protein